MRERLKPYVFPLVLFLVALGFGATLYIFLEVYLTKECAALILRVILSTVFFILIINYIPDTNSLFKFGPITKSQIGLALFLCLLFAINNYFHALYSTNTEYMDNSVFGFVVIGFVVNSFYEEFAYRGFIQGYVNQNLIKTKQPISQGNLFASVLMSITHLGFFVVMDTLFAITGLILVFIYSLITGYMRDKGASIWLLIIIHTAINFIHVILNWEHYY